MPDPIKRTAVTNPDGSVTYKSNWSSSSPGSSSSQSKPATLVRQPVKSNTGKSNTLVRQSSSVSRPPMVSSGSREITSIPPMKSSPSTNKPEIKASIDIKKTKKPLTPQEIRTQKYGPPGERTYGTGEKKEKYKSPDYGGAGGNKAGKSCTTC